MSDKIVRLGKRLTDKRKKKERGLFINRNISGEGIILYYSFILIRKQSNCNASNL